MAEATIEKQATQTSEKDASQETTDKDVIETSDQADSQQSHDEKGEVSDKTEQDAVKEAKRQAQSDFDKQTALLDKFDKSPVIKDRLQVMVDDAMAAQQGRKSATEITQTTQSEDGEDVVTKSDMRQFKQDIQGLIVNAVEAPQQRSAMADMGSFLEESIKAGSITEDNRKRVEAIAYALSPDSKVRLGWDEVASISREFLRDKAAWNILSKMKTTDVTKGQKKQEAMKDIAQPDSASTAQPAKEKDSPEDKTLAEFKKFHDKKSIFAKQ